MRTPAVLVRLAEAVAGSPALRQEVAEANATAAHAVESVAGLERALYEQNWVHLQALADVEFSAPGLVQLRAICRLYAIKNPLIKRGLALRAAYVFGQGVEITARANGKDSNTEQDVQAVVQAFMDDDLNAGAVTGAVARSRLERALGTDGEVFITAFTRPLTGDVQVRVINPDQIADVICNPDDQDEPWYYLRRWTERNFDPVTGNPSSVLRQRYYPALGYRPKTRYRTIHQIDVAWDAPVLHVKVNEPSGWHRGIPDSYAAIDWARAYREFMEDWAKLMRSLAKFAWRATVPGNKAAQVRARLRATAIDGEAGEAAIMSPDVMLEAISKSGATIDADSGRPLAAMAASALGIPVTMLLGDPGVTGARATAETLDRPTELDMGERQQVWTQALRRLISYVITESVRAPQGVLKGVIKRDPTTGKETLTLAGDTDPTIDVVWPPLDDVSPELAVRAIVEANSTGTMPPLEVLRLLLNALGVQDVDEILDDMVDETTGEFLWPKPPPITPGTGLAALDALNAGQDPSAALPGGSMTGDGGDDSGDQPTVPAATASAPDNSRGSG